MTLPAVVVRAPEPRPPLFSLVKAALNPDPTQTLDDGAPAGAWINGITYRPYNQYAAELRDPCDFATVDLPALAAPAQPTAAYTAGGGSLVAATYGYRVSAINGNGETLASTERTITTPGTGHVTLTWGRVHGATGYKVYGRTGGSELLMATVNDNPLDVGGSLTFIDDGSLTPAGALPGSNTTAGPGTYTNEPIVTYRPFLVVVEDSCTAMQFENDSEERARTLLDLATPAAIEREFWTGGLAIAAGNGNDYLTKAATLTNVTPGSGPPSVKRGMQILEDALAATGAGGQGMIHAQPQTVPDLTGARVVGNTIVTTVGNIVVPGSGYTGTGPSNATPTAGTAWLYATDLVAVWLDGDIEIVPGERAQAVDRDVNTIRYRAMRAAAATFDGFRHFAVNVTLAT